MINHDVIKQSYGFTIDSHGEIHGLIHSDMGYENTGIFIEDETLEIWNLGVKLYSPDSRKILFNNICKDIKELKKLTADDIMKILEKHI